LIDFQDKTTMRAQNGQLLTTVGVLATALLATAASLAQPADPTPFQQRVLAAMQGDIRTEAERARDANRMPAEVLEFFRMREDMRVIEVLPAGGWYTKILAPVLRDAGKLYVTHPPGFYADAFKEVADLPGLDAVEEIGWGATGGGNGGPFGPSGVWEVEPVDLVLTFRNYHNFSPADRMTANESTYNALKPGGYYGIVDHTRRHMEPGTRENGRRVDPVLTIKEIEAAGFDFVDFSDLLYRPQDTLSLEVGNPDVSGQTDRYTLLFRKPE
jgi:predicted methyltransferase